MVTGWVDEQGKRIVVYWAGDPTADALAILGLAGTANRLSDLATGRLTLEQATQRQLGAFIQEPGRRMTSLLSPFVKLPIELAAGKSSFTGRDVAAKGEDRTLAGIRYTAETLFRPLREARRLERESGKKDFSLLTERFGLGLPFERVAPKEAADRVAMQRYYERRDAYVESRVDELRGSAEWNRLATHQRELRVQEAAERAEREYARREKPPVSRRERREREFAR